MYGLLLESVRFHVVQRHGKEAWNKICQHCGLLNSWFNTGNSYSDTILPKVSEACAEVLPCCQSPDAYMEYFGNCFVNFTSSMGYSNVLKIYSRSFRDFLDSIDSLHEHLRFEFPRLQSPSFECTEESASGLTLHYRSKRYGYKNYVIGQVKEIAKLYFHIEIHAVVLDESDIVTSFGVKRCHITYRVTFDNNSFTPLVKEHKYLNSMSIPIDLIFNICPFSFLINKDLQIFLASNDLNQYFGENMAGKKLLKIFTLRRPPVQLTWESLVNHDRVLFELIARQASNISLFTKNNSTGLGELSARNRERIERLQNIDKTTASNSKRERKSKSANLLSLKDPSQQLMKFDGLERLDLEKKNSIILPSEYEKSSRGIIMNRKQLEDVLPNENNGSLGNEWSQNSGEMAQDALKCYEGENSKLSGNDRSCQVQERQNADPKPISWENMVPGIKENSLTYEKIFRPDPIGKHNDTSPSHSLRKVQHSTSCPNIDLQANDTWNPLSGLNRPEPIGQEDDSKPPDIRATVILPSLKRGSSGKDDIQKLERRSKRKGVKKMQSGEKGKKGSKQQNKKWFKSTHVSCSTRFFRRKITDLPADEASVEEAYTNSMSKAEAKISVTGSSTGRSATNECNEDEKASSNCSTGLFRILRENFAMVRNACFPVINTRASKVTSAREEPQERVGQACSLSNEIERIGASSIPVSYSEPLIQKSTQIQGNNENMVTGDVNSIEGHSPRRHTYGGKEKSIEESQVGEKRKKVEMWLQRQQYKPLHLRGQIKHIVHWNMVLFIGTPIIGTVEDLESSGLYLSDLSMHDGSRFLTMQGTQRLSEIEFACDREKLKRNLLKETTLKVEKEKRRTEEILYSMMPREIAERMKNGDRELTTCETFDDVTILFGYVTDFTEICNKVEAIEVVKLVREVFSIFDLLSENHKVYKFETIGGGVYMLVSGVPVKIEEHALEMSLMSLNMLETIQTVVNPFTNKPLELQIGIHSGPVVAGVIGQASLQYCLFGHTVNIASRMQTTGDKMKIHISEATNRELIGTSFITEYRGSVPVKGVGNLDTYWLIGRETNHQSAESKR